MGPQTGVRPRLPILSPARLSISVLVPPRASPGCNPQAVPHQHGVSQLLNGCQPRLWFVARRGHKETHTTAAASTLGQTVRGSEAGRADGPPVPSLSAYFALETSVSGSEKGRELLVLLIIQMTMLYIVFQSHCLSAKPYDERSF